MANVSCSYSARHEAKPEIPGLKERHPGPGDRERQAPSLGEPGKTLDLCE